MRSRSSQGFVLLLLLALACDRAEPLTEQKAREVLQRFMAQKVPVYAQVPQRVWWSAAAPRDDFDEKSLRTFDNLQKAGLSATKPIQTADGKTGLRAAVAMIASVASRGKNPVSTTPAFSRMRATTSAISGDSGTRTSRMRCPSSVTRGCSSRMRSTG